MIVVDTNVIAGLWLRNATTAVAERLLAVDPQWAAPLLWRSEMRSVLAAYLRRGLVSLPRSVAIAEDAESHLRGLEFQVPSAAVLERVAASKCSPYDCEFVVLAEELAVPLVTNDREILKWFPAIARRPEAHLRPGAP